jgi:hypothetical protein
MHNSQEDSNTIANFLVFMLIVDKNNITLMPGNFMQVPYSNILVGDQYRHFQLQFEKLGFFKD